MFVPLLLVVLLIAPHRSLQGDTQEMDSSEDVLKKDLIYPQQHKLSAQSATQSDRCSYTFVVPQQKNHGAICVSSKEPEVLLENQAHKQQLELLNLELQKQRRQIEALQQQLEVDGGIVNEVKLLRKESRNMNSRVTQLYMQLLHEIIRKRDSVLEVSQLETRVLNQTNAMATLSTRYQELEHKYLHLTVLAGNQSALLMQLEDCCEHRRTSPSLSADHDRTLGSDRDRTLGSDRDRTLGSDRDRTLGSDRDRTQGSDRDRTLGSDRDRTLGSDRDRTLGSDRDRTLGSDRDRTLGSDRDRTLGSDRDRTLGSDRDRTPPQRPALSPGGYRPFHPPPRPRYNHNSHSRNSITSMTNEIQNDQHPKALPPPTLPSSTNGFTSEPSGPFKDCQQALDDGYSVSGMYLLKPDNANKLLQAWCDMSHDPGGWTVILRRQDGSVNFFRNWDTYKQGFGNIDGEYWLGLESIHSLTNQGPYKLLVTLEDWSGRRTFAEYASFRIESEADFYRLRLGRYHGNAGDSLTWHNGKQFTTLDCDHDAYAGNCAHYQKGGWWYNACAHSNLSGVWYRGGHYRSRYQDGVYWAEFRGGAYSLKKVTMMIRPNTNTFH